MAWKASAAAPTSSRSPSPWMSSESASRTVRSSSAMSTLMRPFNRSPGDALCEGQAALRGQPELDPGPLSRSAGTSPPSSGQLGSLPHGRQAEVSGPWAGGPVQPEPLTVVFDPDEEAALALSEQHVDTVGAGMLADVVQGLLGDAVEDHSRLGPRLGLEPVLHAVREG